MIKINLMKMSFPASFNIFFSIFQQCLRVLTYRKTFEKREILILNNVYLFKKCLHKKKYLSYTWLMIKKN